MMLEEERRLSAVFLGTCEDMDFRAQVEGMALDRRMESSSCIRQEAELWVQMLLAGEVW